MRVLLFLIVLFSLSSTSSGAEFVGYVKSPQGKPLSHVQILTYAPHAGVIDIGGMRLPASTKRYEVETDQNGTFRIPSHGRLIYFHRTDLKPLTKIVDLGVTQIEVIMEEGAATLWKVPACSVAQKSTRLGIGFMLDIPESVMARKEEERFEEGGYLFGYRAREQAEVLINSWESTSLQPAEDYLLQSQEFSQRMWVSGGKWGYEFRGTLPDGRIWRRISTRNGALTYQGNSKEAAKVFDSMIDGMCFDESAVKW